MHKEDHEKGMHEEDHEPKDNFGQFVSDAAHDRNDERQDDRNDGGFDGADNFGPVCERRRSRPQRRRVRSRVIRSTTYPRSRPTCSAFQVEQGLT